MSPRRELAALIALLLLGYSTIVIAVATASYVPLFFALIPFAAIPWAAFRSDQPAEEPEGGSTTA